MSRCQPEAMPRIHFLDVTNRDGVQTARTGLSKFGKTMVNFYLGKLGVAQSEIGFPFLFHEVPYVRAQKALGDAGAFGDLRLSGWCRAVAADVEKAAAARSGPLQPVHLDQRPDAPEQVPRPPGPRRAHPGDDAGGAHRQGRRRADRRRQRRGRLAHRRRVPHRVRARGQGGRRRPDPLLRHDRRRHAGPHRRALREARQRRRDAGRDALPQRPRHGRRQLGRRRARRPRRRPGRVDQHLRQRHRRAVRQRRPALERSWRCATVSASPTASRSAIRST